MAPSKQCRGVYKGYFGSAIAFATKAYMHNEQQIGEMARDSDDCVRRFTESTLARSQDMCLLFCGVLVSRADNPSNGFLLRSLSCSGDCSSGVCCSYCTSQNAMVIKIRNSIKPGVLWQAGNRATIQKIANNHILAVTKICMLHQEVRSLHSQIARTVLSAEIDKHGSHLLDGAVGDEIRWAIGIMDGPITTALKDDRAPEVLELWHFHCKHIGKVNKNGGKGGIGIFFFCRRDSVLYQIIVA
jgi:hypothetical protein